ncbi:tripartite tricarboxylate transporter permease [Devosia nitrariae]|uniref:C4-dicarboxylate ABC transporter permease n=1 Tax=Devosia nitrariae TaxID=2071872 RepID=A0ABQ5W1D0_9HYPH|nr:tripartite tricarboxylate transporter permease [Devosia nitrariae]GLQ53874.1 C4-dicarboxylate ABC transporter permease [Devosia nitrariae]
MEVIGQAFVQLLSPQVLLIMLGAAVYGLTMGAIPGLSASMAVALVIPIAFFLDPVPALAGVMTLAAMAIFAGDLPGALLRIPGTPASAAYVDDAYLMVRRGQGGLALGLCVICSAIGGVVGALVLIGAAPAIARIALQFSSYEKFWLACLGLTAAVAVSGGKWYKGGISLMLGLAIAQVGLDPVSGQVRLTFGNDNLVGGLAFIPVLIGMFAIPEVLRYALSPGEISPPPVQALGNLLSGVGSTLARLKRDLVQGSAVGVVVGAIPGAGADIAAYISYAISKRFSKIGDKYGTGVPDALVAPTTSNNAAVGGALIPATVFGIPGDSLTAIIIGVFFLKGLNPGPTVFLENALLINTVFVAFLIANIMMVPLGLLATSAFQRVIRAPRHMLMPSVLAFCIIGAFAVENTHFAIMTMLVLGLVAFVMEKHQYPLAPAILGLVLGPMLEETFLNSLIRARGNALAFVERPLSMGLATLTAVICLAPMALYIWRKFKPEDVRTA